MMSFCVCQQKGLKAKKVIMTSNCKFMFELSGVSIPNCNSISLKMTDFSVVSSEPNPVRYLR